MNWDLFFIWCGVTFTAFFLFVLVDWAVRKVYQYIRG